MKLTRIALQESRLTLTLVLFMLAGGLFALWQLPRSEDPPILFRYAVVQAYFPGASASRVESQVTGRIENALRQIPEIEFINSVSRTHAAGIIIKIHDRYNDLPPIWDKLRRKIDDVRSTLPSGVKQLVFNDEFGEVFGIIVTLAGPEDQDGGVKFLFEDLQAHARKLRGKLLDLEDVAKVELIGVRKEQIALEYDDMEMAQAGLSAGHLKLFLDSRQSIAPGGTILQGEKRILVETGGEPGSIDDLLNLPFVIPDTGDEFYLGDVVDIRRELASPAVEIMKSSGRLCVGLAISLTDGGNIEKLGREVLAALDRYRSSAPTELVIDTVAFEPDRVTWKVNRFFINLLQSLIIVGVILILTLGLRAGSVIAGVIPMVILAALAVMLVHGDTLNQVALAGFIVVLGILVDNHIVISERILRLRDAGMERLEAALFATRELCGPLLTAFLCTVSGFLPIFLAQSSAGEYASSLFIVVTITLLCSQVYGFTVTPALSLRIFKVKGTGGVTLRERPGYRFYHRLLSAFLRRRAVVLLLAAAVFAISLFCFRLLPKTFFPPSDRPIFSLELEFPAGTAIEHTSEAADILDHFVRDNLMAEDNGENGITNWAMFIGRNAPRFILNHRPRIYIPELAYGLFNVTSVKTIPSMIEQLEEFSRKRFPEARVRILPLEAGPAVGFPVKVRISGEDIAGIFSIVDETKEKLGAISGVRNINDDWGPPLKKIRVLPDQEKAARAGVSVQDLSIALQALLTGLPAADLREEGGPTPLIVRALTENGVTIEDIEAQHVYSRLTGKSVPLSEIAGIEETYERARIRRINHQRTVTVRADLGDGLSPGAIDSELATWLAGKKADWGSEYNVRLAGAGTESIKANRSIMANLPWAGLIITLLLIRQTRSFRRTFIILCAVPMGIIGVVAGLFISGQPFGFMTLVGMISLTGIVVNNAIILIDRIRLNMEEGRLTPQASIVEASLSRLRPILLTTITTIGGILPLYMRGSPIWQPMAAALIFGLLFSTLLVLGILPVLYAVLFKVRYQDS